MSYIGTEPKDIRSFGRTKFDYTATQGQTAFTGADDDGKVLAFTVGQIEVYVNGILMDDSDFTTTGTGTVTLATAANLNDVINIVSFETNIPDSNYVPASGGTFTGDVDFGSNKITYANLYNNVSDLPSASTYHGMFAHVHNTGLAYYSHAGAWIPLANLTGATFTGLVNLTNTYSSDTTEQLRISDNTGSKLDFFGNANGNKSIQAYADDGSTFYDLNLQPLGGYVKTPNQPFGLASSSVAETATGKIELTSNMVSRGGMAIDSTNDRFTVPVSGAYLIGYSHLSENASTQVAIRVNGVQQSGSLTQGVAGNITIANTIIRNLSANDYVEFWCVVGKTHGNQNYNSMYCIFLG